MPDVVQARVDLEIAKANLAKAEKAEEEARTERLRIHRERGKSSFYETFGEIVRERRSALGLSKAELGRCIGLTRASVANIELGRQAILLDRLVLIADALACDPGELIPEFGGDNV